MEFFTGAILPLPFMPDRFQQMLKLLPFASMQNVPLRIYSGDLTKAAAWEAIVLQIFWLLALLLLGRILCRLALKKITVQGG